MTCLIFKLKHVTPEEADEVRQLLADNNISIYETSSGFFGTSVAGYWLHDDSQADVAKALLVSYSEQRFKRVNEEYQLQRESGEVETMWQRFKSRPLQMILAYIAILFILSFTLMLYFVF